MMYTRFSDTTSVDTVLQDAAKMISPNIEVVGPKNASRIWGFVSKFVMLDQFSKTLFGTDFNPGIWFPGRFVLRNI